MVVRKWSREELCELVSGKAIGMRDRNAGVLPVPDWLAATAREVLTYDSNQALEMTYPDDRPALIDVFLESVGSPGEPCPVRLRINFDGEWKHHEIVWLNLLDNDDVAGLLYCVAVREGPPIVPPEVRRRGDHDATNWMVMTVDDFAHITSVEGRLEEVLGYQPEEIIGRQLADLVPQDDLGDGVALWVELCAKAGNVNTSRRPWVRKDGTEIWLEASYLNRGSSAEAAVLAVFWDITERIAQEKALHELTSQLRVLADDFQLLADEVPSAVFRCDASGKVFFNNARWTDLLADREGITRVHDLVSAEALPVLDAAFAEMQAGSGAERRSLELTGHDGASVFRLTLRSMGDASEGHTSFVGSVDDVTANVRLRREAREDTLTGLLNRQALEERLIADLAADPTGTLLAFIDLDGFKSVNDVYGHDTGDLVLEEIGRRLRLGVRPEDAVGRYGGDEFVVVCRHATAADPTVITGRLEIALAGPIEFAGGSWQPSASIGTARPEPGEDLASVLHRADMAMFEVKRTRTSSRAVPQVHQLPA